MRKNIKKIVCGMLAIITILSCVMIPSMTAFAIGEDAGEEKGTILIHYIDEGTKIVNGEYIKKNVLIDGATFSAALVAREDVGKGRFEWVSAVKKEEGFKFATEDMFDKEQIEKVAIALHETVADKLNTVTRTTNEDGECTFTDLERGVYLVWESKKEGTAEKYHDAVPFLVEVPDRDEESENFDIEVYPKPSLITDRRISITGTKKWEGKDVVGKPSTKEEDEKAGVTNKKEEKKVYRPDSITLRLYANGVEIASTTTNAKKGWAFSFDDVNALDENGDEVTFTIKEDKVKGYIFSQDEPIIGENTIVINVKNKVGDPSAQTSDESNLFMWIALMGVSAMFVVLMVFIPAKKKEQTIAEKVVEKHNQ